MGITAELDRLDVDEATLAAARLTVCERAVGFADAALLLDALGLLPAPVEPVPEDPVIDDAVDSDGGSEQADPAPFPEYTGAEPCAGADPELFFPHPADGPEYAKGLCRPCPVLRACLAYALTHDVQGVWGATDSAERAALRRRHGVTAEPVVLAPRATSDSYAAERARLARLQEEAYESRTSQ
jgi:hypothetical protein